MKTFEKICKMTQNGIKEYMTAYLTSNGYQPIKEDGFIYAKGTIPVLLVAHMDTVHKETCKEVIEKDGVLSSPQGIGGDDRCGIYIIMNLVKEFNCSVLLCEDEEIGGVGAVKFTKTPYIKELNVNYMVEFDRKGSNDAVYYSCDNREFKAFVESATSFKEANGSFSDISKLMPAAGIAAVNVSCGYYNAHMKNEYVRFDEMLDTIEEAKSLIKARCEEPFKYIAKQYNYKAFREPFYYQENMFDDFDAKSRRSSNNFLDADLELELEVIYINEYGEEESDFVHGNTKAECWFKFFMTNTNICYDMVSDYSFT